MKKKTIVLIAVLLLTFPFSALAEHDLDDFFVRDGNLFIKGARGKELVGAMNITNMTLSDRMWWFGEDLNEFYAYYGFTPVNASETPELGDDSLPTGLLVGAAALTLCGAMIARKKRLSAV